MIVGLKNKGHFQTGSTKSIIVKSNQARTEEFFGQFLQTEEAI